MLEPILHRKRRARAGVHTTTPLFASLRQACTVVDDFESTVQNLASDLGIGPFKCWYFRPPVLYGTTFRGAPTAWTMKLAITWLDDVQWEVITPMDGPSLYREHLTAHGRGVQHLLMGTGAVPFEEAAEELAKKGLPFAQTAHVNAPLQVRRLTLPALPRSISRPANLYFGYLDAEATLRTAIELTRYPLGFSERFSLRTGKAEFCIPEGDSRFERSLPNLRVRRISKVTLVTRDLEDCVRRWIDLARVRPWRVFEVRPEERRHVTLGDAPASFRARVAWGLVGDIVVEIVQPLEGKSPLSDILETRGEGVASLGVEPIPRFDDLVAHCAGLGYRRLMNGSLVGSHRAAYLGARHRIGTDLEIVSTQGASMVAIYERTKPARVID
jgi:hypothetical protein